MILVFRNTFNVSMRRNVPYPGGPTRTAGSHSEKKAIYVSFC